MATPPAASISAPAPSASSPSLSSTSGSLSNMSSSGLRSQAPTQKLAETSVVVREAAKNIGKILVKLERPSSVMIVAKAMDVKIIHFTRLLACHLVDTPRSCNAWSGLTVFVDGKFKSHPAFDFAGLVKAHPHYTECMKFWSPSFCAANADSIDFIITLGGDGTVLYTSWLFQQIQVPPIIPFHLGSLGFLTNFNVADIRDVMERVIGCCSDGVRVNMRMRLSCTVWRHNSKIRGAGTGGAGIPGSGTHTPSDIHKRPNFAIGSVPLTAHNLNSQGHIHQFEHALAATQSAATDEIIASIAPQLESLSLASTPPLSSPTSGVNPCSTPRVLKPPPLNLPSAAVMNGESSSAPPIAGRPFSIIPPSDEATSYNHDIEALHTPSSPGARLSSLTSPTTDISSILDSISSSLTSKVNPAMPEKSDGVNGLSYFAVPDRPATKPVPTETFQILNDLVVDRGPSAFMSQLELFVDDRHLTTVQADGLVISTPTGSTAYSLSAGGSIVHPEVPSIGVTPICPHTLSFRPMLLPDSIELKIQVPRDSRSTAWASFDGRHRTELRQGDFVVISLSRWPVPTVCSVDQSTDWFESLRRCLHWNERARQKPLTTAAPNAN